MSTPQKSFALGALSIPEESLLSDTHDAGIHSNNTTSVLNSTPLASPDASSMHLPSVRIPVKLKKHRGDGYESDAVYASDIKGKQKENLSSDDRAGGKKVGGNEGAEVKDEEAHAAEERGRKEVERQRATSFTSRGTKKAMEVSESLACQGYETDAPTRKRRFGRKKKPTTGYETDASVPSSPAPKKSKTKFFGLGGKSSKSDLTKNRPPLDITPKSSEGFNMNATTQLPTLPVLPSLDTSFAESISLPRTSPVHPVSAPPIVSATPFLQVKSTDLKQEFSSEKRVRDSHVSGESSRSSTSHTSSGPSREAKIPKYKGLRFFSSSKSSPASPSSKYPTISFPLGRSISPSSLEGNANHIQHQPEAVPSGLLRSLSPSPTKPGQGSRGQYTSPTSPALLSPSSQKGLTSPTLLSPPSPSVSVSVPSSPAISRAPSLRPRGSHLTVATNLSIGPSLTRLSSNGGSRSSLSPLEGVAPSPPATKTGFLPSTLSYYDIPPPSPPPNAPLPKIPDIVPNEGEDDPFGVNGSSVIRCLSPTDRRDVPFLSRLRARAGSHHSIKNTDGVKGLRIAKLHVSEPPRTVANGVEHQRPSHSLKDAEPDGDGADGQEMQDVLDRFAEASNHRDEREAEGKVLGRSRSFEVLPVETMSPPEASPKVDAEGYVDEDESFYSREFSNKRRSTLYGSDYEDAADPRLSRWSGSIYSRASFMDAQKSEETRSRFVKRVEAMLDDAGIERGNTQEWNAVPPVPKLPDSLARSNILTRQNQLKSAGAVEEGWVRF